MTFVRLAMGTGRSGALASIRVPVAASARSADRASIAGARIAFAGVARAVGNGERLPFGGTGVGGGTLLDGAATEGRAAGPAAITATVTAATMRRRPSGLTPKSDGRGARCAAGPA